MSDRAVKSIMSRPVVAVRAGDTLADALWRLSQAGLRHLAVVDGSGACVGLLNDRTLAAAWAHNPMAFDRATVASILEPEPPIVPIDATVSVAARKMHHCGTDAVVVVDDAMVARGVFTAGDIIALLARPEN